MKKKAKVMFGDAFAETTYKGKNIFINLFPKKIREKYERKAEAAQYALDEQIKIDTSPYVPMRSGTLDASVHKIPSGAGIVMWSTPYAQYQHQGKLMVDKKTGSVYSPLNGKKKVTDTDLKYYKMKHDKAGPFWYDRAYVEHGKEWVAVAKEAFKRAK